MPARIDIFNQAVAILPATQMTSPTEESLEARECRRFYPQVIANMLAGPHRWSFQNRRVALAQVTNSRDSEWAYAYAVPSDMGAPIRVIPDLDSLGLGIPVPLAGDPYAETWASFIVRYEVMYLIENGVLYANTENATLEYGINDVTDTVLPPLVVKAIVTELAAWLAVPVKKDKDQRQSLLQEAELYWQRAMAEDQNRQPQYWPDSGYIPEALLARGC